jgi:hypothetical protein
MSVSLPESTRVLLEFRNQIRALARKEQNPSLKKPTPDKISYNKTMGRASFALWKTSVEDAIRQANGTSKK